MSELCRRSSLSSNESPKKIKNPTTSFRGFVDKLIADIRKLYVPDQIKWMNERPKHHRKAYEPTELEHIANIITHGFWILPALVGVFLLYLRSQSQDQLWVTAIYGSALILLFCVSTAFHCVFYCNKDLILKDILHRCDRAMIYIFIAASYFPWLNLGHTQHPYVVCVLKWAIWTLAGLGIIYQQLFHEKYKSLETVFYLLISVGPATVVILCGHEFIAMPELKIGGLIYLVGVFFFKADGKCPLAHAVWHLFVVLAASVHYFAVLKHLYSEQFLHEHVNATSDT